MKDLARSNTDLSHDIWQSCSNPLDDSRSAAVPTGRGYVQAEVQRTRHLQHGGEQGRAPAGQLASQLAARYAASLREITHALCVHDGRQRAGDDLRVTVAFDDAGFQQGGNGSRVTEACSELEQFEGGLVRRVSCGIGRGGGRRGIGLGVVEHR